MAGGGIPAAAHIKDGTNQLSQLVLAAKLTAHEQISIAMSHGSSTLLINCYN